MQATCRHNIILIRTGKERREAERGPKEAETRSKVVVEVEAGENKRIKGREGRIESWPGFVRKRI